LLVTQLNSIRFITDPDTEASCSLTIIMSAGAKRPPDRLKFTIRLLPPGLTELEFKEALRPEWLVGGGKVDWMEYSPGKVAKNPSKHSTASTAWLHLTDASHIVTLEEKIRSTSFADAKNTSNDPILIGPPLLEYAVSQKIPSTKKRVDSRMGTIDQDPDFKRFLESLTNPIQKPAVDLEASLHKDELKVTTTPLIEHLREKKAAKEAKPSSKSAKEARELGKNKRKGKDVSLSTSSPEKSKKSAKADRAARQAVKVLTRQASAVSNASSSSQTQASEKSTSTTPSASPAHSERRRERSGPFNIAAKIQRDLGLGPASPRRGPKSKASTSETPANGTTGSSAAKDGSPSENRSSTTTPPGGSRRTHRGSRSHKEPTGNNHKEVDQQTAKKPIQPIILKKPVTSTTTTSKAPTISTTASSKNVSTPTGPSSSSSTATSSTSTPKFRAFLKHANASQGITEPLLHTALSTFGSVRAVEIDKRKGIAHADFADASGLAAATKAGRVEVANGAVQILPFRERGPGAPREGGGGTGSRGASGSSAASGRTGMGRGGGKAPRGQGRAGSSNAGITSAKGVSSEG
jgi:regulator of nonsense transcripts 3